MPQEIKMEPVLRRRFRQRQSTSERHSLEFTFMIIFACGTTRFSAQPSALRSFSCEWSFGSAGRD
jgi:hypothetical protein